MANEYSINFKIEVYKELAANVSGFLFRNYIYPEKPMTPKLKEIMDEAMRIECGGIYEVDTHEKLEELKSKLLEMNDYIHEVTPQPHQ